MSVRTDTDIHPQTLAKVSRGEIPVPTPSGHARRRAGTWNSAVARERVDEGLLRDAIARAGGDTTRLWFDVDGWVWILNHSRATRCPSPACPACHG